MICFESWAVRYDCMGTWVVELVNKPKVFGCGFSNPPDATGLRTASRATAHVVFRFGKRYAPGFPMGTPQLMPTPSMAGSSGTSSAAAMVEV